MNTEELHWLCGYLEGEGCFSIGRRKKNNSLSTPMVSVVTTDKDVADKTAALIGALRVRWLPLKENRKQVYGFSIHGESAIALMKLVLPFMGERRKSRIKEVLRLAATRPGIAGWQSSALSKLTEEQVVSLRAEYSANRVRGMQTVLARKYGIAQSSVWKIVNDISHNS